jgi:Fe-S-cluster-containing hydrogenase component 2
MAAQKPDFLYTICAACAVCSQVCPLTCIEMTKTDYDALKKSLSGSGCRGQVHRLRNLQKNLPGRSDSLTTLFRGSYYKLHFCEASFFKGRSKSLPHLISQLWKF